MPGFMPGSAGRVVKFLSIFTGVVLFCAGGVAISVPALLIEGFGWGGFVYVLFDPVCAGWCWGMAPAEMQLYGLCMVFVGIGLVGWGTERWGAGSFGHAAHVPPFA